MDWSANSLLMAWWFGFETGAGRFLQYFTSGGPLDESSWEKLREKLDFNEIPPETSEPSNIEPATFNFPMLMEILRFGGVVLIIALLVFILVRIFGGKKKKSKSQNPDTGGEIPAEPTAQTPIDVLWKAFHAAKTSGNLREALRILYQISIKKLSIAGLVKAHPDKTNWEYVSEIGDPERARDFSKITLVYETHWYGDEAITDFIFAKQEPQFIQFIEALPDE